MENGTPQLNATAAGIVDALHTEGLVRAEDRDRAYGVVVSTLRPAAAPGPGAGIPKLVEVVAYLGAALVLAASTLFLAQTWDDLGGGAQVGALFLGAAVLGVAGRVARGDTATVAAHEARRRLAGTLFAGAAVLVGSAVAVWVENARDGSFDGLYLPAVLGGGATVLAGLVGYRLASSAVGLLPMLGGLLVALPTAGANANHDEGLWVGGAFFVVGVLWIAVSETGAFDQRTIARSLGCSTAVFGAQFIALATDRHALGYVLTGGIVVGSILLYLAQLAWPYLTAAVIGTTFAVPEAVNDWSSGNLDVISGVMLTGITLLVASFAGYKISTEVKD